MEPRHRGGGGGVRVVARADRPARGDGLAVQLRERAREEHAVEAVVDGRDADVVVVVVRREEALEPRKERVRGSHHLGERARGGIALRVGRRHRGRPSLARVVVAMVAM